MTTTTTAHARSRDLNAEIVADAEALLRGLANGADINLWACARGAAASTADADAAFIAAMTPLVAVTVANFLGSIVRAHEEHSKGLNWDHEIPRHALAISKAVLLKGHR